MGIIDFVLKQILAMKWLNDIVEIGLSSIGVEINSRFGASLVFFIYDTIKILILLSVLVYMVSFIQTYFSPERARYIISKVNGFVANILAALLGTITPFCSCSSIPLFIGFTAVGLPIGVTFSFLISSPMVDLGSLVLLMSVFNPTIAILYVIVGLVIAVVGGHLISMLKLEDQVADFIKNVENTPEHLEYVEEKITLKERNDISIEKVQETLQNVFVYILIGVGIGALIHNYIPNNVILSILGNDNPFSVLIAVVVGIPIYADIFGTIPIAEALYAKGVGIGTVLAFMMATTTLSLPSILMLSRAIKRKLLVVFISIVSIGIIITGYIFNLVIL